MVKVKSMTCCLDHGHYNNVPGIRDIIISRSMKSPHSISSDLYDFNKGAS